MQTKMDNAMSWRRSTGSTGASGSRDASLSRSASMARADKHLLVYRRRTLEEREAAAAKRREEEEAAARLREEQQAAVTLKQLGECFRTTQVIQLPTDRPKPTPKPRRYHVSPNLEEKVKAGVMLCWLKKGMKKMKEALKIGRGKDKGQVYHRKG
jgi:hypothetical protein